ncbi:uncharacterized protein LOC118241802 [Electrophorus electricus]|uniref:uncharacterized protein LOC118241802 n=1 Tax=Electrophorus electricus TaxID=8005 RepID=UPI0015D0BAC3|nr:uncharacterized protein LOC118241802 [Electrophorus electricus]
MLPPNVKYYLNRTATFSLMSAILNDSLKQMNLSLMEIYSHAEGLFMTGSSTEDVAQNLLVAALTKMQDFVQLCTLSDWLSGTQGFPINNHEELEMLPSVTTAAVGVIVENMLNVCSEGTSCDFNEYGSDRPLWYFLQTVCDNINSATPRQPTHGAYCSMANEQLSIVQQANSSTKQCHTVGVAPYDPTKLLRIVPTYLSYEGSSDESLT